MYLGRTQLGQTVALWLQCVNAADVPVLPANPPSVRVLTGTTLAYAGEMPIHDRTNQTGLFHFPMFLGSSFGTGHYQVCYQWRSGSFYGFRTDNFEVVPGGHADGHVVGLYFYERPHADFVVQSLEDGTIIKGRNPVVR